MTKAHEGVCPRKCVLNTRPVVELGALRILLLTSVYKGHILITKNGKENKAAL